jgi:hypothetical protein
VRVRAAVLIGEAAAQLEQGCAAAAVHREASIEDAVRRAGEIALPATWCCSRPAARATTSSRTSKSAARAFRDAARAQAERHAMKGARSQSWDGAVVRQRTRPHRVRRADELQHDRRALDRRHAAAARAAPRRGRALSRSVRNARGARAPLATWRRLSLWLWAGTVYLLLCHAACSRVEANGARRWHVIPGIPFAIQARRAGEARHASARRSPRCSRHVAEEPRSLALLSASRLVARPSGCSCSSPTSAAP